MSQTKDIENHLLNGFSITPIEALEKYGCFRLSARINDLRKTLPIQSKLITKNGKSYSEYSINGNIEKNT